MMCEVLPTIDEASPSPEEENSRLEQLMISMLEEREKLMDKLRETQEAYQETSSRLSQLEADNGVLMRQLQALLPQEEDQEKLHVMLEEVKNHGTLTNGHVEEIQKWPIAAEIASLARELATAKETVITKEEEVQELKAERANMKLLLEHLECLVSRHEKSLRVTVLKRQTANTGVSSEVEVLKALKSLFDHHKALDEKVRERLRSANEKNAILDEELALANQEIKSLQDEIRRMKRLIAQRNSFRMSANYDAIGFTQEQLSLLQEKDQAISDMQFSLDEKTAELEEVLQLRDELTDRVQETEDELEAALRDLHLTKTELEKLQQSSNQQESVSQLQMQLASSQDDFLNAQSTNKQLSDQISLLETQLQKQQDDYHALKAELKQKEVAVLQARSLSEEQLRKHSLQLTEAEQQRGSFENRILELEALLQSKSQDLISAQEKETVNEQHIERLQNTVERMLKESNQRLKTHFAEKKVLMDDRNTLTEQVDSLQSQLSHSQQDNMSLEQQITKLKKELQLTRHKLQQVQRSSGRSSRKVTDLDQAKWRKSTGSDLVTSDYLLSDKDVWDVSEPGAVSRLMSILEGQVSALDQELENMDHEEMHVSQEELIEPPVDNTARVTPPIGEAAPPPGSPPPPSPIRVKLRSRPDNITSKSKIKSKGIGSSVKKVFRRKSSNSGNGTAGSWKKLQADKRNSAPPGTTEGSLSPVTLEPRSSLDLSEVSVFLEPILSDEETKQKTELVKTAISKGTPFSEWQRDLVIAWLEAWVGVPSWYISALKDSVNSGSLMESLTEVELSQMLGITNSMHRLKLRLALQEIMSITTSSNLVKSTPFYGDMDHNWISDYWLPSIGLPQYSELFRVCLIDSRMLEHLTKKDLRTVLKMLDSTHRNSLQYGISVLKKLDYNRKELESRRQHVSLTNDVLVWTNEHVIKWVESIGLNEYAPYLIESGIHGGVLALDHDFDIEGLVIALKIPPTQPEVWKHLKTEFNALLTEGTNRSSTESQSHGRIVKKISKRLKMGRRLPSTEFLQLRPTSPVLYSLSSHSPPLEPSPSPSSQVSSEFEVDSLPELTV